MAMNIYANNEKGFMHLVNSQQLANIVTLHVMLIVVQISHWFSFTRHY